MEQRLVLSLVRPRLSEPRLQLVDFAHLVNQVEGTRPPDVKVVDLGCIENSLASVFLILF